MPRQQALPCCIVKILWECTFPYKLHLFVIIVDRKQLWRSLGIYFPYLTQSVSIATPLYYWPRSRGDNTFGSVRLSVRPSVRLSIRPFVRTLTAGVYWHGVVDIQHSKLWFIYQTKWLNTVECGRCINTQVFSWMVKLSCWTSTSSSRLLASIYFRNTR